MAPRGLAPWDISGLSGQFSRVLEVKFFQGFQTWYAADYKDRACDTEGVVSTVLSVPRNDHLGVFPAFAPRIFLDLPKKLVLLFSRVRREKFLRFQRKLQAHKRVLSIVKVTLQTPHDFLLNLRSAEIAKICRLSLHFWQCWCGANVKEVKLPVCVVGAAEPEWIVPSGP